MQKLRADLTKHFDSENTNMTAYRDYDFERRVNDMRRLQHAVDHFDHAVRQGMMAMKEIASAYEAVGQAFTELTLTNNNPVPGPGEAEEPNPYPTEADVQYMSQPNAGAATADYAASVASTRMPDEANSQVRRLAKTFAEEARRINEGAPYQSYNAGIHRDVHNRLLPVLEHLKSINEYRHKRIEALERYNKYKAEVEKVEKHYTKKGKPFCDSKDHKKYTEKRDEAWKEYIKRRDKFNKTFGMLMEVNDHAAAQIIHRYLVLNHEYLQQLVASMDRVLPAMAEVYPLNNEYNSLQNTLILEAVANAKMPFADHSKTRSKQADHAKRDGAGDETHEDAQEAMDAHYEAQQSTLTSMSSDGGSNIASGSRLEDSVSYDAHAKPSTALESMEPPHDPVQGRAQHAGRTRVDRGLTMSEPQHI
ncbi:hypothetical protein conserved [Leishmania donovani]|uniref:Uncharacterized protein n=3 Tax=Leishmania donovani species complex TaxID=38574 RepID=A4HTM7_LEIIN|nr:hypothetical protein, unknown function [Leishmania infantum JPCM5]TPP54938.1 hypothetical protein CGC20_23030 [Leishmania donovani]CAC9451719.1 hypothetical_protein_-_conserved [Leishmania infantum]CAJ1986453.1 hypothetical protein conserved [Leishmania donovani]CAM65782.1 hypothetical protein, unknown function [Leishmania infantum JPCM5]SUZ39398.1 hypothetical_protein_-_conserved [Leishmania infantum]|eukprot:XP_001463418.1 hypothetical protein, unknown function [Leishmania infantum JPCM5]